MPDRPPPNPTRHALLQLMRTQSEEAIRFSAVFGDRHGLHQTDVSALAAISRAAMAGTPIGPARLADELHLSRPATTALVDRLAQAGHVVRHPDPDDRRRTVLTMEPAAVELAGAFFGRLGAAYGEVMDRFTADELGVISRFLEEVVDATITTRTALATPDAAEAAPAPETP